MIPIPLRAATAAPIPHGTTHRGSSPLASLLTSSVGRSSGCLLRLPNKARSTSTLTSAIVLNACPCDASDAALDSLLLLTDARPQVPVGRAVMVRLPETAQQPDPPPLRIGGNGGSVKTTLSRLGQKPIRIFTGTRKDAAYDLTPCSPDVYTMCDAGPADPCQGETSQLAHPAPHVVTIAAPTAAPKMTTEGLAAMPQVHPASTRLRDIWEAAMADRRIDDREADVITILIEDIDDGTHAALAMLKGGRSTRRACEAIEEFERLHGPIDFENAKKRRDRSNDPDAA